MSPQHVIDRRHLAIGIPVEPRMGVKRSSDLDKAALVTAAEAGMRRPRVTSVAMKVPSGIRPI
jgi:hypothetical protein